MKSSALTVLAALLGFVATAAQATAQIADSILIEGQSELLCAEPLESAFRATPSLRQNLLRHISSSRCTASWRG